MLFKEDYKLEFCDSGWECLDRVESSPPDLIILDVMMPGLSGFDVCKRLKSDDRFRPIPIILLTALNKKEDILQGLESGAEEFVSKPVSAPEIRARVKNLLAMKKMRDELARTLEFRQDLTRFLVHDMRNPLISIRLTSELGLLDKPDPGVQESFQKILGEVQTLHRYVDEMLLAATLENAEFQLRKEPLVLGTLIEKCLASPLWKRYENLFFEEQAMDGVEQAGTILADKNLLERLLENLISNAVKYGGSEPVTLRLSQVETNVTLQVADHGPGIPLEYRETIFEKHGIVPSRKAGGRQTGLGLYFCRLVVEAHGGEITVGENTPEGAVFTVRFPAHQGLAE